MNIVRVVRYQIYGGVGRLLRKFWRRRTIEYFQIVIVHFSKEKFPEEPVRTVKRFLTLKTYAINYIKK